MNGEPVLTDLQELLQAEIRIANDANCFALSEATDGAAKDAAVVFGVIIGTGTGQAWSSIRKYCWGLMLSLANGGITLCPGRKIMNYPGRNVIAVNMVVSKPGYPGRAWFVIMSCITTCFSMPRRSIIKRALATRTPMRRCERYENRLARSLAHVINILDPDVIVLGGGMGNIKRLYQNVPGIWGNYVFSDVVNTKLVSPVHGDSSGVRGAAWLWNS
jgi:fructokinase